MKGDIIVWSLIVNKPAKITVEICLAVTAGILVKTRESFFNETTLVGLVLWMGNIAKRSEEVMWNMYGIHTLIIIRRRRRRRRRRKRRRIQGHIQDHDTFSL